MTPCTIEMLPASRLESCARNSVGRRSLISRSLRKASGFAALRQAGQDRGVDRDVALAAAGGDDHVGAREHVGVALDAGGVEREPGGIGADALPRLHLALIALLRDLLVEIERRERMHDVGREGRGVGAADAPASSACQCASGPSPRQETMPMPVIQASRAASAIGERLHRQARCARRLRCMLAAQSRRSGNRRTRNVMRGVADQSCRRP